MVYGVENVLNGYKPYIVCRYYIRYILYYYLYPLYTEVIYFLY